MAHTLHGEVTDCAVAHPPESEVIDWDPSGADPVQSESEVIDWDPSGADPVIPERPQLSQSVPTVKDLEPQAWDFAQLAAACEKAPGTGILDPGATQFLSSVEAVENLVELFRETYGEVLDLDKMTMNIRALGNIEVPTTQTEKDQLLFDLVQDYHARLEGQALYVDE